MNFQIINNTDKIFCIIFVIIDLFLYKDYFWMLHSSVLPGLYYVTKPTWNLINNGMGLLESKYRFTPLIGMDEEGHKNAPGAALFYLINKPKGMTLRKMFKPAIDNCKCMLNK